MQADDRADPAEVLTVGEPLVLMAAKEAGALHQVERFERCSAGAELNVAIGLARLGVRVTFLGRVGDDSFGRYLLGVMDAAGIDRSAVAVDPVHATGFMLKGRSDDGRDPPIEYHRRGSAGSRVGLDDLGRLQARCGARLPAHLHLTGIAPALSQETRELVFHLARQVRAQGGKVSFDPNLRPALWRSRGEMVDVVNQLAGLADLVLPGLEEGRLLSGRDDPADVVRHFIGLGAEQVVVKLGASGALCGCRDGTIQQVPAAPVARVVDTVGAGDGFAVGAISALLEGCSLRQAAARGAVIGARVVQFPGDADGLPDRQQLEAAVSAAQVALGHAG